MTPWTRGRIFHTGHALRQRVRPQAPISRSSRLAGREFVRANGGRPGQAMPAYGMAEDPLTIGGTREPRRSAPRPRVALTPLRRLRARAAGEPSGAPPPGRGDARPGFVYLGCVRSCNVTCHYFKLTRGAPHRLGQSHLDPYYELRDGCNSTYRSTDTAARGDVSSRDDASGAGSARPSRFRTLRHLPAACGTSQLWWPLQRIETITMVSHAG